MVGLIPKILLRLAENTAVPKAVRRIKDAARIPQGREYRPEFLRTTLK